jgi:DNA-binding Lrp family transcriptional regulator
MDHLDHQLVDALREDGRTPLAALGVRVGLSGDAVRERLRHLTESGIVQVTCSVDPHLLGYDTMALVALTVTGPAERIAEQLVEVAEFDLVCCITGRFDLIVEAVCRDEAHLLQVLDEHVRSRPDVSATTVFSYLEVLKFAPGGTARTAGGAADPLDLTPTDLDIIAALQRDGRASFQDIADQVGVSYQMARRRAKSLLESGVVQVETVVNRLAGSGAVVAQVGLTTSGPVSTITPAILALDEVEVAVVTAGPFDLLLEVVCRDRHHLSHVVGERIRSIRGVEATETSLYQRLLKLPQSWSGLVRRD